jgi:hypothetical protein
MSICKKICNECPFSNKSLNGWLGGYSIDDVMAFQRTETSFPCHKMMTQENLSQAQADKAIKNGNMKLCRGYVESMVKSCKSPFANQLLIEAIVKVKAEGLSEDSMAIWDFKKHHDKL